MKKKRDKVLVAPSKLSILNVGFSGGTGNLNREQAVLPNYDDSSAAASKRKASKVSPIFFVLSVYMPGPPKTQTPYRGSCLFPMWPEVRRRMEILGCRAPVLRVVFRQVRPKYDQKRNLRHIKQNRQRNVWRSFKGASKSRVKGAKFGPAKRSTGTDI